MNARITVVGSLFLGVTTCLAPVTAHAERALAPEVEAVFAALARPLPPCAGSSARVAARPDQSRPHDCNEPIVAATVEAKGTRETVRVTARQARSRPRAARKAAPAPQPAPTSPLVVESTGNTPPEAPAVRPAFQATPEELAEYAPLTPQEHTFGAELLLPPPSRETACRDFGTGPSLAACMAVGGLTPEVAGLRRLACLFDAVQRYKLATVSCAQQRIDQWQATVMWPRTVLDSLRTAVMARVDTLREHADALIDQWRQPESFAELAAAYTTPERAARLEYERGWGASRGPDRDQLDVMSWLSVTNRDTIQGRTSAAFGLAGELPESTWERIGREGSKALAESRRDPLAAIRHTPQMLADRARVEANTARLDAQALLTEQILRDYRRAKHLEAQALGDVFLYGFTEEAQRAAAARRLAEKPS